MEPVKYTPAHIDGLIRSTVKMRQHTVAQQQAAQNQQSELRAAQIAASEHEGFCMKCKDKRSVVTADLVEHKNGMKSLVGECPECGSNVHRFHKKDTADG